MQSIDQIVAELGDRVLAVHGDMSVQVAGFSAATPGRLGHISFVTGSDRGVTDAIAASASAAFLAPEGTSSASAPDKVIIEVARPRLEFARVAHQLFPIETYPESAGVHSDATVGEGTVIGTGAVLEAGVVIGRDSVIGPNVVIRSGCLVGDRVRVGPGSVIGEHGFGFERDEDGRPIRLPHYGGVHIGNDVEIGANTVVDRGVFVDTTIAAGAKIDSQVLIGHNVVVQEDALVIGGTVLCGGVRVGPRAWIAPSATVMEKMTVGTDSTIGIGATVCRDVPDGETVMGPHARPALRMGG